MRSLPAPVMLQEMPWTDAKRALDASPVGLIPVGATEAHGPHLPLDTDTIIAEATACRAATRLIALRLPALVYPAISYSVTFAGTSFAGTSPVDPDPFEAYLRSVLTHMTEQPLRGIVVCNAHLEPAHVERVQAACAHVESATGKPVRSPDQRSPRFAALLSDEFRAGARHAGSYETSIILAARPEKVRLAIARELEPVWIDLPARLREGARTFLEAGATLGYFGDPARATSEEGESMLDALAEMVTIVCQEMGLLADAVTDSPLRP